MKARTDLRRQQSGEQDLLDLVGATPDPSSQITLSYIASATEPRYLAENRVLAAAKPVPRMQSPLVEPPDSPVDSGVSYGTAEAELIPIMETLARLTGRVFLRQEDVLFRDDYGGYAELPLEKPTLSGGWEARYYCISVSTCASSISELGPADLGRGR